ncbi:hypothetical protein [Brachybacterium tyrofermentans]|uniref:Uncharacterized protein n=1 Tax=Brachybacterium tyrofermentans TaxID=47848 RepID=A0ABW0FB35_9MICO
MADSLTAPLTRRRLLLAGALGLAAATSVATIAPASAADEEWTEEFMTRPETREGFLVDDMDDWQVDNARFIIAVCKGHGLGESAAVITLITAIVESWLYNYDPAVDADSGGLFQQRPSMGWGTAAEVRHKKKAVDAFLGLSEHSQNAGLTQLVADPESWDPGTAAQTVQSSAFPDRYAEQVANARLLWQRHAADVDAFTD